MRPGMPNGDTSHQGSAVPGSAQATGGSQNPFFLRHMPSNRFASSIARGAYTAGRRDLDQRSIITDPQTPGAEPSAWIDDAYLRENPWYQQNKAKPIFSLARPLPHLARGPTKAKVPRNQSQVDLAERGELETPKAGSQPVQRQATNSSVRNQNRLPEHTPAGTAHQHKKNDAGQPVFDYMPNVEGNDGKGGNDEKADNDDNDEETVAGSPQSSDTPEFKIDGKPLGQREHDDVENGLKDPDELRNWWARVRAKHPEPLAEFLATGVAIFMGLAGSLSVYLSQAQPLPYGSYETACWAWGFAWMFGVYLGGGVSGAHMNPAISISLSVFRGFPWRQCAMYVAVQFIAAIVAGALAYGVFADTIRHLDPTLELSSQALLSTPQSWVSPGNAFLNQCVGSAIMMIAVFALGDDQNNPPGAGMHAFVLGLLVTTLKFTMGFNIGSALNPASDFGPRVIAYAVGYRHANVFSDPWWIYGPWAATLVGSFIGCIVYDSFVFVGSESPVNYRYPPTIRKKIQKKSRQIMSMGNGS
ncbi:uncharacterized protein JN550_008396 [Neoarthrinium moseri]|uniref:uncharacterized protein n=1 Tax=Neoarthrinium moseri TaxID=1658444 RepID=UPI001FDD8C1F|nr:uncharacterized protein JN550_008396 [Neoarthrinium moseri]KAI1865348.1 hypothetical protein JN550_008396 [Neoarthrinium moseri]